MTAGATITPMVTMGIARAIAISEYCLAVTEVLFVCQFHLLDSHQFLRFQFHLFANISDNDCTGDLVCFQRNWDEPVPGCADNPDATGGWDYVSTYFRPSLDAFCGALLLSPPFAYLDRSALLLLFPI